MTRSQEQELLNALRVDIDQIDDLVAMGHYTSRADFLRMAVEKLLIEHRNEPPKRSWREQAHRPSEYHGFSSNIA